MSGVRPGDKSDLPGVAAEPRLSLPTSALLWGVVVASLLVAGLWSTAMAIGPWSSMDFTTGLLGIGIMMILAVAGVLVLSPWRQRAIADWMTMWLAATVFRLLVTPVFVYLIYSAASVSLPAKPLGLSVALTYLATLFIEAAIIARHVNAASDRLRSIRECDGPA
jgi:hypothetical protein